MKDPRRKQGQRFSIISIVLLALAAILSNHLSELAIAEWGAGQSDEIKNEKRGDCAVSIDGKAQRGRLKFEEKNGYPVHAVSMVEHQTGIVLIQGHVEKTDVETKSKLTGDKEKDEQDPDRFSLSYALRSGLLVDPLSVGPEPAPRTGTCASSHSFTHH